MHILTNPAPGGFVKRKSDVKCNPVHFGCIDPILVGGALAPLLSLAQSLCVCVCRESLDMPDILVGVFDTPKILVYIVTCN